LPRGLRHTNHSREVRGHPLAPRRARIPHRKRAIVRRIRPRLPAGSGRSERQMSEQTPETCLGRLEAAARAGSATLVFARLHEALTEVVGFKVLTVLKLDPATLRSGRLYSR